MNPAEPHLLDATERELAATTFDANVVVTAGAGTGKTTLLVNRLVHLLMRDPDPLELTDIVALTFTNKAANEIRIRLRERLQSYLCVRLDEQAAGSDATKISAELRSLVERYHLSKEEIDCRARAALRLIERGYIGTIHSFAALLLRLYPVEAGVDPQFKEDDGSAFKKYFDEQWSVWLDQELGREGHRHQDWKRVLARIPLDVLRETAFSLCSETVPLNELAESSEKKFEPILQDWLADKKREAAELIKRYPESHNQIDGFACHALAAIKAALQHGEISPDELEEEKRWFAEKTLRRTVNWSEEDYEKLRRLCRVARGLFRVDRRLTQALWQLVVPFAEQCRENFIREGFVSFDGLLVRARNLLRDHRPLREEFKHRFKAILIDEFQDTDPIQYEILLYLAEKPDQSALRWQSVQIQPGKIFVVGDPKQSIYAFRRADIQGYLDVVRHIILAQGGVEYPLTTNFRSHSGILDVVNGVFTPLICAREGLQPDYVPIQSPKEEAFDGGEKPSFRGVSFCKIQSQEQLEANPARRLEAENLARWLDDEVLGKARIRDRNGEWIPVQPHHVALLFRKLTEVHLYLEPLRRRGIPYVVEGEKHFYATQEIVDGVNLLRAVADPYDHAALVGLLRSPIGALSDWQIYDLHREGLLDYRSAKRAGPAAVKKLGPVRFLYETLDRLHWETRLLSVADAVHRIFETIPVRILAARSFNGEQAVANIEKIREQASIMGRSGSATLKEVVAQLKRRVLEIEEESESALAEENIDAIKILSIHKAKGLEFPVVILPDARGAANPGRAEIGVQYDWSSNLIGLQAMNHLNLAAVYLDEKRQLREEEEQKRLFYVAMTRAREHVTISCPPLKVDRGSFAEMLQRAAAGVSLLGGQGSIPIGIGYIEVHTMVERPQAPKRRRDGDKKAAAQADWSDFVRQWEERRRRYEITQNKPLFVSPTALKKEHAKLTDHFGQRIGSSESQDPLAIGNLAHHFLETLDFSASPERIQKELRHYIERQHLCGQNRQTIECELVQIFAVFLRSKMFAELSSADIVGREIPLLMPWNGQVMEGVVDLIYLRRGLLYIGDYKTDRIVSGELGQVREAYRYQAQIYSRAVQESLQRNVAAFKLIFLRTGQAIEITP